MPSAHTDPPTGDPSAAHASWFHELESAWLYRRLALIERDPPKQQLFLKLAAAAEEQAVTWARHLPSSTPAFQPSARARLVERLTRWLGPKRMRTALIALKLRGLSVYNAGPGPGHAMPQSVEDIGRRHRSVAGGNLRAAVFGINDGLLSNASLILGVAGAGVDARYVLTSGVAGLLAGALSMAAGEYVSVRSQREMYEYQIGLEADELAEYPDEEAEELALIYAARGMDVVQARQLAQTLIKDPAQALDALSREELGINPDDLGSPWGAAIASFVSFAAGANDAGAGDVRRRRADAAGAVRDRHAAEPVHRPQRLARRPADDGHRRRRRHRHVPDRPPAGRRDRLRAQPRPSSARGSNGSSRASVA